jgi:hypothetical protein
VWRMLSGTVRRNGAWRTTFRRSSNALRGRPDPRGPTMSTLEPSDPVSAGVRAAGLLEEACRATPVSAAASLRLGVVRDLAQDTGRQLDVLAREDAAPDILTEAALHCADLANLSACNAPGLPPDAAPLAAAAARLAAGAVRALRPLIETSSGNLDEDHAGNLLKDVRAATWRAEFADRLVDESLGGGSLS